MQILKILCLLPLFLLLMACDEQGAKKTTDKNQENQDSTEVVSEKDKEKETLQNKASLEEQWNKFKQAILAEDLKTLKMFPQANKADMEMLLNLFVEDFAREELKKTNFEDLEKSEETGRLVFSATIEGVNDEGYEVGSGLFLYFSVEDNQLKLENYLAAG